MDSVSLIIHSSISSPILVTLTFAVSIIGDFCNTKSVVHPFASSYSAAGNPLVNYTAKHIAAATESKHIDVGELKGLKLGTSRL